jgi:hypothetical protein
LQKYKDGRLSLREVIEGIVRLVISTEYSKIRGKDRGYIFFQDFIPNNTHDIRVTFVNNKCFAARRKVRLGDFRASGSGLSDLDMSQIPVKTLRIASEVSLKLHLQTAAFDFVTSDGEFLITEISYGFGYHKDQFRLGYWDERQNYYPGEFDPFGWMVEEVLQRISEQTKLVKEDRQQII